MNSERHDDDHTPRSSDRVDFRAVLYGNPAGATSIVGVTLPTMGLPTEGGHAEVTERSIGEQDHSQVMWASTHYGEWLEASSPSSRRPLLPEGVKRVGEAQRIRGIDSYRGPSGISQTQSFSGAGIDERPVAATTREAYLGSLMGESYVGCHSSTTPSVYGIRRSQRGGRADFNPGEIDESEAANVYVLAPSEEDPCGPEREQQLGMSLIILYGILCRGATLRVCLFVAFGIYWL